MTDSVETLRDALQWEGYPVASTLAHGTVDIRIGRVGSSGPVGVLTAGAHGDEGPWGALAINQLLRQTPRSELLGTLRVVPMAHPLSVEANARQCELDLLNLNGIFPGNPKGTHTERVAAVIAEHALDGSDYVIDVHGGGSWNVNCFVYRMPGSHDLADWMGAPLVMDGIDSPTSLVGYARGQGAKGAWVEMGGKGDREEERIAAVTAGLRTALGRAGVLTPTDAASTKSLVGTAMSALVTSSPGIYQPLKREADLGTIVDEGTVVGQLLDPVTSEVIEVFRTPYRRGMLALLRPTLAVVEGSGKVVAVVAEVDA